VQLDQILTISVNVLLRVKSLVLRECVSVLWLIAGHPPGGVAVLGGESYY
jgi:hypothetical protein